MPESKTQELGMLCEDISRMEDGENINLIIALKERKPREVETLLKRMDWGYKLILNPDNSLRVSLTKQNALKFLEMYGHIIGSGQPTMIDRITMPEENNGHSQYGAQGLQRT